ncbi:MAG: flavin reductase family protein, partial [bacterium]
MEFRKIDPADIDRRQIYRLLVGSVVPRPIAWVSTISKEGRTNLAPFSFFTCVSGVPPMLSISVGQREDQQKHTTRNILETQGYVIHVVVNGMEEQMNVCAGNYPPEVSESDEAGLE